MNIAAEPPAPDLSSTRSIIAALGGAEEVRKRLGKRTLSAIYNWHVLGFPASIEGDLLNLAYERGVTGVSIAILRAASDRAVAEAAASNGRRRPGRPSQANAQQ